MKYSASLRLCQRGRDPPPPKWQLLDRGAHILTVAVRAAWKCCNKPSYLRPGLLNNERCNYFRRLGCIVSGGNPDSPRLRWTEGGKEAGWLFQALAPRPQLGGEQVDAAASEGL